MKLARATQSLSVPQELSTYLGRCCVAKGSKAALVVRSFNIGRVGTQANIYSPPFGRLLADEMSLIFPQHGS
jgi:hypothetical protein